MPDLFNNKYRIPSARLQNWNYVIEVETQCIASLPPTEIGKIAYSEWFKTTELRPDMNFGSGKFVVMPNRIHGIIVIGENKYNTQRDTQRRDAMHCVSTNGNANSDPEDTGYKNQFVLQSKNLASVIRGNKSALTIYARKNNIQFDWYSRFHDHVIRSYDEFVRISRYVQNEPG